MEYSPGSVTPEIQLVQSDTACISESALAKILNRPIALDKTLPLRWVLLHDKDEFRVYAVGHHIAVDGHSMSILSKEFLTLLYEPECALEATTEFKNMHMLEVSCNASVFFLSLIPMAVWLDCLASLHQKP